MGFGTGAIIPQIIILAILAMVGVLAVRLKILDVSARAVIEKLVFYITLPLMIVTKVSQLELTPDILRNGVFVIGMTYVVILIQVMAGKLLARLLKLDPPRAVIHILHTFLGNIVFLGFPLLDALFPGGEAILYAALYQLTMNSVLWTWGISKLDQTAGKGRLKKMLNPNTVALVIGLLMMGTGIRFPEIILKSLGGLGQTTLYLAMIYIGILLSRTRILQSFTRRDVLILSINKLVLLPLIFLFGFYLAITLLNLPVGHLAFSVVVLEAAMPCMTILVILARRYGADDHKAMENFVVSTLLSILSLPFMVWLLNHFAF